MLGRKLDIKRNSTKFVVYLFIEKIFIKILTPPKQLFTLFKRPIDQSESLTIYVFKIYSLRFFTH
jgi:hypothetical protein